MASRLPTANLEQIIARRREDTRLATERRVEREKELAVQAAQWLGDDLADGPLAFRDQFTVVCKLERAHAFLVHLRNQLGFEMMNDLTAIDTLKHPHDHPERFAVLWTLTNLTQEAQLRVKAYVNEDDPVVPTVSDVWPAANWAEREVYDMYGIEFSGHPNLVRLLLPEEYSGFPLRKDYPLRGRGERDNFPVIRRAGEEDA